MFKKLLIILCFFFSLLTTYAQNILDFKNELKFDTISDTAKVSIHLKISDLFSETNKDSAIYYNEKALDLANKLNSTNYIGYSLYSLGILYENLLIYTRAIEYYKKAVVQYKKADNKLLLAKINRNIGACYIEIYQEDKGLEYYLESLSLYKNLENKLGIASIYMRIGDLYYNEENYDFAIKYLTDAQQIYQEEKNNPGIANCYTNIGNAKADSGLHAEGLELYEKSIAIQNQLKDTYGLAINYNNIGDCYIQLKQYGKAKEYLNKALVISEELKDKVLEAVVLLNLSTVENKLKNYNLAITFASKSLLLSKGFGSLEYEVENLSNLSFSYEKKGNILKALSFHKELDKVKDSISINNQTKKVQLFQALNRLESNQYKIEELANENKITQLKYNNERKFMYFLVGSMVLFGFFVVLLIQQQTAKKNAYNLLEYKNHQINKMNDEIKIQRDDLERSNKTKDTFFSIIAHDLRNPFNSIKGFSELMIENSHEYDEDKRLKFLKIIKASASNASSLLNNLLIWANSQSGNLEFNPQKIDVSLKVANVISLLEIQAINKEIEIINTINKSIYVYSDRNMVESILRNLISNAIKFTERKGCIKVYSNINLNFVEITVKDNGIGISAADIKNLFSIEVKNSTKGTANEKGSGLGLILCKDFVERNGGRISVKSTLNKGSEFTFTLPLFK